MATPTLATAGGRLFDDAYAGLIANQFPHKVQSFINASATGIEFGVAVASQGGASPAVATDRQVKPWSADSDLVEGISVRNAIVAPLSTSGSVKYDQYQSLPVIFDGVIWVIAAEDVRKDDQVLIITAGGSGNSTPGALGGSKGGIAGSGRVDYPNAKWLDTTLSGKLGRILIQSIGSRRTTT